jgi:hypothetical protein
MEKQNNTTKLRNGLTPIENLLVCIEERTATAETFESAIKDNGLTCEIIRLIKEYYPDQDIK